MQPGGEGEHPPRSNGDGWINGLLNGAEKFLNAVLGSDTPSSSSSSSTSDSLSSEEKDWNASMAVSTTRNDDLNQKGKDPKLVECWDQDLAIVSEIDSKQAIEQLLREETFSRDECNNLVILIQSRVIDSEEQPISWDKTPQPTLGFSLLSPHLLSRGSSPYWTPDLEQTAVNEAKKWSDAKKSPDGGPCVLNTNMLEFDPETGSSPVEMARSYMNSLDQKNRVEVLKRGYEISALGELPERTKKIKLMLTEGSLDVPKFQQFDVNSTVPSSYKAQASIGPNDTPILTAIPLEPSELRISESYQIRGSTSKVPHNTNQVAWVPYVTCAKELTEIRPGVCVPPTETCSISKLILHEDIVTVPNTSRQVRGGRARRGRGKSGARNGVAGNLTCGKSDDNGTKKRQQKTSSPRPRRGRGAKLI